LIAEGVARDRIDLIGNIMIDSYEMLRDSIAADGTCDSLGLGQTDFGVVTLHRPSNVDTPATLGALLEVLTEVSSSLPLVFAVHPRTRKRLKDFGLEARLAAATRIKSIEPLGYVQFMNLVSRSKAVITDSGGVQEETTHLGIPCFTLRENTERPITTILGSNQLVRPDNLVEKVQASLTRNGRVGKRPDRWDGNTASRAVESLKRRAGLAD
jgi:UDP-N-acetylglucosamine 2-epimerase (non-hydrolysing)